MALWRIGQAPQEGSFWRRPGGWDVPVPMHLDRSHAGAAGRERTARRRTVPRGRFADRPTSCGADDHGRQVRAVWHVQGSRVGAGTFLAPSWTALGTGSRSSAHGLLDRPRGNAGGRHDVTPAGHRLPGPGHRTFGWTWQPERPIATNRATARTFKWLCSRNRVLGTRPKRKGTKRRQHVARRNQR